VRQYTALDCFIGLICPKKMSQVGSRGATIHSSRLFYRLNLSEKDVASRQPGCDNSQLSATSGRNAALEIFLPEGCVCRAHI
jgi:hypothetical protein